MVTLGCSAMYASAAGLKMVAIAGWSLGIHNVKVIVVSSWADAAPEKTSNEAIIIKNTDCFKVFISISLIVLCQNRHFGVTIFLCAKRFAVLQIAFYL